MDRRCSRFRGPQLFKENGGFASTRSNVRIAFEPLMRIRTLIVPKGCSTVSRRTRMAFGFSSRRRCTHCLAHRHCPLGPSPQIAAYKASYEKWVADAHKIMLEAPSTWQEDRFDAVSKRIS